MSESPVFAKMKEEGTESKAPLTESFLRWNNLKIVLIALFGITAGLGCVWYAGQFYVLLFLTQTLKVDSFIANLIVAGALLLATPFFLIFGALSDRIGRKKIILSGMALAVLTYFPIFKGLTHYANPALEMALQNSPVVVVADPGDVGGDLDAARQPHAGDLAEGGVRLLRGGRVDARADAPALGAPLERGRLVLRDLVLPALADQLLDRGHYVSSSVLCVRFAWLLPPPHSGVSRPFQSTAPSSKAGGQPAHATDRSARHAREPGAGPGHGEQRYRTGP